MWKLLVVRKWDLLWKKISFPFRYIIIQLWKRSLPFYRNTKQQNKIKSLFCHILKRVLHERVTLAKQFHATEKISICGQQDFMLSNRSQLQFRNVFTGKYEISWTSLVFFHRIKNLNCDLIFLMFVSHIYLLMIISEVRNQNDIVIHHHFGF